MITDRYYVKIVPERGETVHRFQVRRRHMAAALGALALVILGSVGFAFAEVVRARMEVAHLAAQAAAQQASLRQIDRQTETLRKQLQHVQKQNTEIRQLIGAPPSGSSARQKTSWVRGATLPAVAARVDALSAESVAVAHESDSMRQLAMHVLNIRHLRDLARAQMIAAIPSIDPVDGAEVIGCYCYRTYPDVEFHPGVDLDGNYGDAVRASAAGTVVANWYDGGYGIKIDIDHGNGYHTWYAHLSRVMVAVGTHVYKGQNIGLVGATGFATGPHLHYQVMYEGSPVDPTPFLHGVPANVLAALP
ncbi:MAG TPA: M23 family metallopeptidase [Candidatus Acidoferrum sp.]|jgi:murein DD-endopeptidase MepM/ murein hydrolase activator NlpD|nr:M23 family metallopeptidase [Candidatus Acidoferrum sp.]